jgi:hypothetical protein
MTLSDFNVDVFYHDNLAFFDEGSRMNLFSLNFSHINLVSRINSDVHNA